MVLETLLTPSKAENKPYRMMILGFLVCLVAGLLTYIIFMKTTLEPYTSMAIVFFTALACVPLMYGIIRFEEEKDLEDLQEKFLLKEHSKALKAFMFLFLGITVSVVVMYVFLPWDVVSHFFAAQNDTLMSIRGGVTGMATAEQFNLFAKIFFNNVKVLIFAILFSFIYGAGAIFIMVWNASVIGAAIGNFIRGNLALYSELIGLGMVAKYFHVFAVGLLKYALHGIPEILAYFTAALAGGIISVAVIKHDLGTAKFEHIILDSADLLLISIGLLFGAAVLEVWVTPLIFSM
jgi:uncharacterized membrane protein SpoIIM required for sporulation